MNSVLTVDEARARSLDKLSVKSSQEVGLLEARNRVLASDVYARLTQPPFDASAMDGYAVRTGDLTSLPCQLEVIGEAAAGHPFQGNVGPGQAVRIFTGAPVPAGADCIVIQENTTRKDDAVIVHEDAENGAFIRPRGMDFAEGARMLTAGTRLNARQISLVAAANIDTLPVTRKPHVAILATGDELVSPGTLPGPGQIISSIPFGLAALIEQAGGRAELLGIAKDTAASLRAHLEMAGSADILVTIGGVSVGDHDIVQKTLVDAGMELDFWKIAMRPGKPMIHGRFGTTRVLGVPGNPVSALITARVFLVPMICRLLGLDTDGQELEQVAAGCDLAENGPRQHYMRAISKRMNNGRMSVVPAKSQDSSLLATLSNADCLIVRPPGAGKVSEGEPVDVLKLDF